MPLPSGPICPACELGYHDYEATVCEKDYKCICACHGNDSKQKENNSTEPIDTESSSC